MTEGLLQEPAADKNQLSVEWLCRQLAACWAFSPAVVVLDRIDLLTTGEADTTNAFTGASLLLHSLSCLELSYYVQACDAAVRVIVLLLLSLLSPVRAAGVGMSLQRLCAPFQNSTGCLWMARCLTILGW